MLAANVTYLTLVAEALPLSLSLSPFLTLRRQQAAGGRGNARR
jgi:hypothetical protein